jgi:hypothetical protein
MGTGRSTTGLWIFYGKGYDDQWIVFSYNRIKMSENSVWLVGRVGGGQAGQVAKQVSETTNFICLM